MTEREGGRARSIYANGIIPEFYHAMEWPLNLASIINWMPAPCNLCFILGRHVD